MPTKMEMKKSVSIYKIQLIIIENINFKHNECVNLLKKIKVV